VSTSSPRVILKFGASTNTRVTIVILGPRLVSLGLEHVNQTKKADNLERGSNLRLLDMVYADEI
jgi:hypothetical protein